MATLHLLEQRQVLPISLDEAWEFFSRPENLDTLTPPDMKFRILEGGHERMFAGQIIRYRIRIAPGVWTGWVTEIPVVEPPYSFVDEQRFGPYKFWHHQHRFEEVDEGVLVHDRVNYAVGWGPLGELAHALYVRRKLKAIFAYRRNKLQALFPRLSATRVA